MSLLCATQKRRASCARSWSSSSARRSRALVGTPEGAACPLHVHCCIVQQRMQAPIQAYRPPTSSCLEAQRPPRLHVVARPKSTAKSSSGARKPQSSARCSAHISINKLTHGWMPVGTGSAHRVCVAVHLWLSAEMSCRPTSTAGRRPCWQGCTRPGARAIRRHRKSICPQPRALGLHQWSAECGGPGDGGVQPQAAEQVAVARRHGAGCACALCLHNNIRCPRRCVRSMPACSSSLRATGCNLMPAQRCRSLALPAAPRSIELCKRPCMWKIRLVWALLLRGDLREMDEGRGCRR